MSAPTEPSTFINWTDGSPSKVIQPPSAQQLSGWTAGEPMPFQYLNWLFYILDQWTQYLSYFSTPVNLMQSVSVSTTVAQPTTTYLCSGSITMTLPAVSTSTGYAVCFINVGSGTVGISAAGSDNFQGSGDHYSLGVGESITFISDGVSSWWQKGV